MSMGLARVWRKKALKTLIPYKPEQILDIAAGTADLSIKGTNYYRDMDFYPKAKK